MEQQIRLVALAVQSLIRDAGYPDAECIGRVDLAPPHSEHFYIFGVGARVGDLRHGVRFWSQDIAATEVAAPLIEWLNAARSAPSDPAPA